jgi:aspartate semialdehyde dehydrogenase (EC 1.2.1.11)
MKRVGLIGWRGMVGSVLMQRMLEEQDFDLIEPVFFTTSNVGGQGPNVGKDIAPLKDAYSIEELKTLDVILTCQGGDYTNEVFPKLREAGWQGYWIDAARPCACRTTRSSCSTRSTARSSTSSSTPVPRTTSAATALSA